MNQVYRIFRENELIVNLGNKIHIVKYIKNPGATNIKNILSYDNGTAHTSTVIFSKLLKLRFKFIAHISYYLCKLNLHY